MKAVLQHPATLLFFSEQGYWTPRWEDAMVFENLAQAIRCLKALRLLHLQVVLRFPGGGKDVIWRMPEAEIAEELTRATTPEPVVEPEAKPAPVSTCVPRSRLACGRKGRTCADRHRARRGSDRWGGNRSISP
jgi:hypothetical protein